jgi:N-sulfoglucosamine sulfohydrolase
MARDDGDSVILEWRDTAFGSHQFHSLYAYYPMRSMVSAQFRLIHNLNFNLRYPILEDVFNTKTWADIEAAGESGNVTGWVYDYHEYMFRPEWQLFDVSQDPLCLHNLAENKTLEKTLRKMQAGLRQWQVDTSDPWAACNPSLPGGSAPVPGGDAWEATHSEICAF